MLRDNLVGLIEPMRNSAGINPSRAVHSQAELGIGRETLMP